jgi:hypothetical protein
LKRKESAVINFKFFIFFLVYTFLTIFFIYHSQNVAHGGEVIYFILPTLWILGSLILLTICWLNKQKKKNIWTVFIIILCTPIPTWIFLYGYNIWVTKYEFQKTQKIYKKNGYVVKEYDFIYQDRKEFRSNFDSKTGELLLDSVYRYDKDKQKHVTDIYTGWERLLESERK